MKTIKLINQFLLYIAMIALATMMLLTVSDVFMRFTFSRPITGTPEIIEYMMVFVVFLGLGWCALQGRHILVELVVSRFSKKVQITVDIITYLAGLLLCLVMSWQTFLECLLQKRLGYTSQFLKVPTFPFYIVIAVGFAIFFIVITTLLFERVAELLRNEP